MRRSSFTTTTSTSPLGSSGSPRRTRCLPTSCTSRGRRPTTGTCCLAWIRRAIHDGMLANDVVGVPHAASGR